jgi:predicted RNA-binding Zn-ribbon protein involved in translation (DUF1610 family)
MTFRWVKRRSHTRRLANGVFTTVQECWVPVAPPSAEKKNSYRHPCPVCGTEIISVRMPNGGWAHFEGREGLTNVKHPCMHMGERLSKKREPDNLDWVDEVNKQDAKMHDQ